MFLGKQLQPDGVSSSGRGLLNATPDYSSSQNATPGRAFHQLDTNAVTYQWRLCSLIRSPSNRHDGGARCLEIICCVQGILG
ncbi:hypothetical protein KUCAC02_015954 [Chaenocephalus aceratus]|uniref:Uncharacterized protein n=1 Tax=Chaenocephalus aceratus TaxID=36190 RepID=A0ACB9Y132_CHAAC|nr:hypothetical protein KUCAC02_015954 [Chaenocephalus aceratus]